jgi:hypothetical protein
MSTRDHKKRRPTENVSAKAPAGILALQRELRVRLVSSGGRPSDPAPTIRRLVTLKKDVWKDLQRHAALLSRLGQHVSPGQLAAMLIEKSISDL